MTHIINSDKYNKLYKKKSKKMMNIGSRMVVTSGSKHPYNEVGMEAWNRLDLVTVRVPAFVLDGGSKEIITLFKITEQSIK